MRSAKAFLWRPPAPNKRPQAAVPRRGRRECYCRKRVYHGSSCRLRFASIRPSICADTASGGTCGPSPALNHPKRACPPIALGSRLSACSLYRPGAFDFFQRRRINANGMLAPRTAERQAYGCAISVCASPYCAHTAAMLSSLATRCCVTQYQPGTSVSFVMPTQQGSRSVMTEYPA